MLISYDKKVDNKTDVDGVINKKGKNNNFQQYNTDFSDKLDFTENITEMQISKLTGSSVIVPLIVRSLSLYYLRQLTYTNLFYLINQNFLFFLFSYSCP